MHCEYLLQDCSETKMYKQSSRQDTGRSRCRAWVRSFKSGEASAPAEKAISRACQRLEEEVVSTGL